MQVVSKTNHPTKKRPSKTKLFISGISASMPARCLTKYFKSLFPSTSKFVTNAGGSKKGKKPRGFGFLILTSSEEAQAVLSQKVFYYKGRYLRAEPFLESDRLKKHTKDIKDRRVFVGRIPREMGNLELRSVLEAVVGPLENAYSVSYSEFEEHQGFGYAVFRTRQDTLKALEMGSVYLEAWNVELSIEKVKGKRAGKDESEGAWKSQQVMKTADDVDLRKGGKAEGADDKVGGSEGSGRWGGGWTAAELEESSLRANLDFSCLSGSGSGHKDTGEVQNHKYRRNGAKRGYGAYELSNNDTRGGKRFFETGFELEEAGYSPGEAPTNRFENSGWSPNNQKATRIPTPGENSRRKLLKPHYLREQIHDRDPKQYQNNRNGLKPTSFVGQELPLRYLPIRPKRVPLHFKNRRRVNMGAILSNDGWRRHCLSSLDHSEPNIKLNIEGYPSSSNTVQNRLEC